MNDSGKTNRVFLLVRSLTTAAILVSSFNPIWGKGGDDRKFLGKKVTNNITQLSCDVVIVGGGISGLYVAETLLRLGKETNVCLFERDDRFGGRIHDHTFQRLPNIPVSLGAWRIDKSNTLTWEIINRFNIPYQSIESRGHHIRDRMEARGVFATTTSELQQKAFPTLSQGILKNATYKDMVAFKGFAVYENALWENNSTGSRQLGDEQEFLSNSDCLGFTFPYKGRGPNGEAVLHTSYAKLHCAVKWGELLKISKQQTDRLIHEALERLFPGVSIPKPLETVYYYWENGFEHVQRAGTHVKVSTVSDWAKRPFPGQDVFIVGEAYNLLKGWVEGALRSAQNALQEGWQLKLDDSLHRQKLKPNKENYFDLTLY
ncbi:hypothetical protein ACROYT_G020746 [Oculina patagonica]